MGFSFAEGEWVSLASFTFPCGLGSLSFLDHHLSIKGNDLRLVAWLALLSLSALA